MGENPKPTATITLQSMDYSGTTLTCVFSYSLSAMSGANYWGYGVNLEYGVTSSLGSSVTLVSTSTSQWNTISGSVQIVKTSVTSSPQNFYFRLNAVVATSGTPGATSSYEVSFPIAPTLAELTYFPVISLENPWSVGYKLNGVDHVGIRLYVWRQNQTEADKIKIYTEEHYDNNGVRTLQDSTLFTCYNLAGTSLSPSNPLILQYELSSNGPDDEGNPYLGSDFETTTAYLSGTSSVKVNGAWQQSIPFIRASGAWKPALMYIKSSGTWRRCLPKS
jgi:hypothetical protein